MACGFCSTAICWCKHVLFKMNHAVMQLNFVGIMAAGYRLRWILNMLYKGRDSYSHACPLCLGSSPGCLDFECWPHTAGQPLEPYFGTSWSVQYLLHSLAPTTSHFPLETAANILMLCCGGERLNHDTLCAAAAAYLSTT